MNTEPLTVDEVHDLRALVERLGGLTQAAEAVGTTREAIATALAGFDSRRGTRALIRAALCEQDGGTVVRR